MGRRHEDDTLVIEEGEVIEGFHLETEPSALTDNLYAVWQANSDPVGMPLFVGTSAECTEWVGREDDRQFAELGFLVQMFDVFPWFGNEEIGGWIQWVS